MRTEQLLLLTLHGVEHEKQSFYNMLENRYQTTSVLMLGNNKHILGSAYGWLVLLEPSGICCLWNPTSEQTIELPDLERPSIYTTCVLSKPPTEPDCYVIFNGIDVCACKIGDDEFVTVSMEKLGYIFLLAMASFQGVIYGIVDPGYGFVTIHLVGETVELRPILLIDHIDNHHWKLVPQPSRSWVTSTEGYLIESPCGDHELLFVTKMFSGFSNLNECLEFSVFRVDVRRMTCEEIDNIDGLTIFIGYYGNGFCRPSSVMGSKPNSIYYTQDRGRVMYVYDLEDMSTTSLLPCPTTGRHSSVNYWVDIPASSFLAV